MPAGDNVGINPGSAARVAADLITRAGDSEASFAQFVKLLSGVDGSTNAAEVDAGGNLRVIEAGLRSAAKGYVINVGTSPVQVMQGGAILAGRKTMHLQNWSSVEIEVGFTATFTLGTGTVIPAGQSMTLDFGTIPVYVLAASGTTNRLNVIEAA